jgi:hypothetical protein
MTQTGSPDPRNDRVCITSLCPRQFPMTLNAADSYVVGNNFGSLKCSPRTIMAQAIRAILLASATAATLIGRRSMRRASQGRFVPCWRAYRMTAMAPATSSQRKCRLPCNCRDRLHVWLLRIVGASTGDRSSESVLLASAAGRRERERRHAQSQAADCHLCRRLQRHLIWPECGTEPYSPMRPVPALPQFLRSLMEIQAVGLPRRRERVPTC